jgi:hypothetical protein
MNDTITYKTCSKCGVEKPLTKEYFKERKLNSGNMSFRGECLICHNEIAKNKYNKRVKIDKKIPLEKKCDKCNKIKDNTFFHKNRGRIDGLSVYCKDCSNEYKRTGKWLEYEKQRQVIRSKTDSYKKYQTDYNINRRKTDVIFKLKYGIRSRIRQVIKRIPNTKRNEKIDNLGCDWETLKNHIESQFTEGMTWDNHGQYGWHIDHHIPLATAKTEQDVYRLNHYTNLKPLWWHENLKKGDKISKEWGND